MFGRKKTEAERDKQAQEALAGYRARFDAARGIVGDGEKYAALKKLDREIERKSVKTRRTRRRVLFRKYGFIIAMPPAIAATTALLVSVIGYPAFFFSMTLAWVGGVRALNRAERAPEKIPYRIYQAKKEAEAAPFRALQGEIRAVFNTCAAAAKHIGRACKPSAGPKPL